MRYPLNRHSCGIDSERRGGTLVGIGVGLARDVRVVFVRLRDCGIGTLRRENRRDGAFGSLCFRPRLIRLLLNHMVVGLRVCIPFHYRAEVGRSFPPDGCDPTPLAELRFCVPLDPLILESMRSR